MPDYLNKTDAIRSCPARAPQQLNRQILRCRLCPRLVAWREQVAQEKVRRFYHEKYWGRPVTGFGDWKARLVVVGLAPAAHGANRTGRMFTGDSSGDWLYEALHRFGFASRPESMNRSDGLSLDGCYVTAAARCAPPANRPTAQELSNCSIFLQREFELLRCKRVLIALGHIAFRSCLQAWTTTGCRLPARDTMNFAHLAEWDLAGGISLVASYHPSRQNTQTGRLTREMFHSVFRRASSLLGDRSPDLPPDVDPDH